MALWEYKVISSGKGGFASPKLLENFLNQIGTEEWEIISFRTQPDNPLAFTGLARRPVQREWTLEAEVAQAEKAEAERKRAAEEAAKAAEAAGQTAATESPQDPETHRAGIEDFVSPESSDWDDWAELEEDLPDLFDAVKPHLRRNPDGLGQSVTIGYLAKKWDHTEDDVLGALGECGFGEPTAADATPEYFEFEGDLFWLSSDKRGQVSLNVREKPRPTFKVTAMKKLADDDPAVAELAAEAAVAAERAARGKPKSKPARGRDRNEPKGEPFVEPASASESPAPVAISAVADNAPVEPVAAGTLPPSAELMDALRGRMRRNRRGPGISGSVSYLAKAYKVTDEALLTALAELGLQAPEKAGERTEAIVIDALVFWLNRDNRGGIWINGREAKDAPKSMKAASPEEEENNTPSAQDDSISENDEPPVDDDSETVVQDDSDDEEEAAEEDVDVEVSAEDRDELLGLLRPLLKTKKRGVGEDASLADLALQLEVTEDQVLQGLTTVGLQLPATARAKPVTLTFGDDVMWLSVVGRDKVVTLNAKAEAETAKPKKASPKPKARAPRSRTRKSSETGPE